MAPFEETHVRLPDGYRAHARYWAPPSPKAGILYLHGIQSHCGWYEQSAQRLLDAGFAVLQPDRRGSGRNFEQRGHADSPQQILDDARACLTELLQRTGQNSAHVLGVSWGGKLAAAMHVADATNIRSLTLVTPGLFPIVDVSAAEKLRIGWSMVSAPQRHFDIPLNDPELFTSSPKWIEWLERDELQLHQATAGFFLASRRLDKTTQKLQTAPPVPLHVFLAEDERIIDNAKTRQFVRSMRWPLLHLGLGRNACNDSPRIRITSYENTRHTLEFEDDCEHYFDDLTTWLLEITSA